MNYVYPAIFYPEENGQYSVIIPDLNDLATYGNDLTDALAMAQEACAQYLFTALRDGEKLPKATPLEEVKKDDDNAIVNLILVDLDAFAKLYGNKAVRKTLSIPAWLDTACDELNISYSKVLQNALIDLIQKKDN